jgi:hypothetical protein
MNSFDWKEFAKSKRGSYTKCDKGFIGGDRISKIINISNDRRYTEIRKKQIRSYQASNHFNSEKLEIEIVDKNLSFNKTRITRRNILQRIGKLIKNQYKIDGHQFHQLNRILHLNEVRYLLSYPKSELIFIYDSIKFNTESQGMMNEDLDKVLQSLNFIINEINKNNAGNK